MNHPQTGSSKYLNEWSYDHFLSFFLVYASHADYEYTDNEKNHILNHVSQDVLSETEAAYLSLGDFEQLDLILQLKKKYLSTEEEKNKLLTILKAHFESDGDYSKLEFGLFKFLKKLFI